VIALLGATGTIGTHVARELADLGVDARAVVRSPRELPLRIVLGDLRDPESLRSALEGADRLFLLTPHGPDQDLHEAAAIDVALAAGVRRIVKISGSAPSIGPNGPTPTALAHWRGEQRIEAAGVHYRLLRPSFLMQNLLETAAPIVRKTGVLAAPMGRGPIAMVDARDVADCAVAALIRDDLPDGAWHLTGPRAVTYPDIAATLGVRYVDVPKRVAALALRRRGAEPWEVEHAIGMARFFAAGADGAATGDVEALTGRAPRSLDDFLSEHADAFERRHAA
jgi:NAD(P)H dehydrogenase (quinone)